MLRDNYLTEIGCAKKGLNALLLAALDRGVLKEVPLASGGKGKRLVLGFDPRKPINELVPGSERPDATQP